MSSISSKYILDNDKHSPEVSASTVFMSDGIDLETYVTNQIYRIKLPGFSITYTQSTTFCGYFTLELSDTDYAIVCNNNLVLCNTVPYISSVQSSYGLIIQFVWISGKVLYFNWSCSKAFGGSGNIEGSVYSYWVKINT